MFEPHILKHHIPELTREGARPRVLGLHPGLGLGQADLRGEGHMPGQQRCFSDSECGKAELWLVVGFLLLFNTLHLNFTGISPAFHQN